MERTLYVRGRCSVCRGRIVGCYYCDSDGTSFIEASDKTLKMWFDDLNAERKKEIRLIFCVEREDV